MIFFFNDTATTEIYTLSLHDALPILSAEDCAILDLESATIAGHTCKIIVADNGDAGPPSLDAVRAHLSERLTDRKSTRLNSSHANISYAVFCLKKKNHHQSSIRNITP